MLLPPRFVPRLGAILAPVLLATTLPAAPTAYYVNASSVADGGPLYAGIGSGAVGNLRYCIAQANENGNPEGSVITITNANTTLVAPLPPIKASVIIQSEINGGLGYGPNTIDAASKGRVFFIDVPNSGVALYDLVLRNGLAKGGAGSGGGAGGGGGAGMGGAIFVNDGSIYVVRTSFINSSAVGGAGGDSFSAGPGDGGGGGLGAMGGFQNGGGGGYYGVGAPGGNTQGGGPYGGGGGGGIWAPGGNGSTGGGGGGGLLAGGSAIFSNPGAGGFGNGGNGGVSDAAGAAGGTGGGGGGSGTISQNGSGANGGAGGQFGGGGGGSITGGTGGDFGGGGAGKTNGGQGGFGGGGGAGLHAGNGGYGGGAGGFRPGGTGRPGGAYGGGSGGLFNGAQTSPGGGGGALGGAFFVRRGILNLVDCGLPTGAVTGGIGGISAATGTRGGNGGTAGQVYFLYGGRTLLTHNTDASIDIPIHGDAGNLTKSGTAVLTLTTPNSYGGYTEALLGTLRLTGSGTLGSNMAPLYVQHEATLDLAGASASAGLVTVVGGGRIINSSGAPATLTVGAGNVSGGYQNGPMTGNLGLIKVGGGSHTLRGAKTYTGSTIVSAGTLILDTTNTPSGPILANTPSVSIAAGGSINLDGSNYNAIAPNTPVTVAGLLYSLAPSSHTLNALTIDGASIKSIGTNPQYGNYSIDAGTWTSSGTSLIDATEVQLINNPGTPTFQVASGTLTISSRLTDHDFRSGAYQRSGGLTKSGPGTLVLSGANTFTGGAFVNAGTLIVAASGTLGNVGGTTIGSGATLDVTAFGASGFPLAGGRTLTNNGTVLGILAVTGLLQGDGSFQGGLVINAGATVSRSAGTLNVTGSITNNGTLRLANGAVLNAGGVTSFVNNGIVDLITAGPGSTLPTITGPGLVLTAESVKVKTVGRAGGSVTVTIDGYTGHTYTLQRTTALGTAFAAVPGLPTQTGATGATLTFTDPDAPVGEVFYRVLVNP